MRARIWDAPTRLFHWLLVLLIPLQWWTAREEMLALHRQIGLVVLGLLLFRLVWGLIGSSTARFAVFLKGPRAVADYVRGHAPPAIGHNPLGGWSVVVMLAALAVHVALGLFASDEDGLESGPLAHLLSYDASERAAELHEQSFELLLVLIGLHLAAILFYALVPRRRLVVPMITGRGDAPPGAAPMAAAPLWRLAAAAAIAAALTLWIGAGA